MLCCWLQQWRGRHTDSLLAPPEGARAADSLTVAQRDRSWSSDRQTWQYDKPGSFLGTVCENV